MKRKTSKEILAETFRELAESKSIDKITVEDVTKNSGYSIATFYRQFKNKYDLIAWDYSRKLEQLLKQVDGTYAGWLQALNNAATYYDDHKKYLANLLVNARGYESFTRYMNEIHFHSLTRRIRDISDQKEQDKKTKMIIRQYCFGTVMLTCEWIMGKYSVSRDVLVEVYAASLPKPLVDILSKKK